MLNIDLFLFSKEKGHFFIHVLLLMEKSFYSL